MTDKVKWTKCSCGHIAQDHNEHLKCERCDCKCYDGYVKTIKK